MHRVVKWFAIVAISVGLPASAQKNSGLSTVDYSVYDAVLSLMQFPKQQPRIVIEQKTLNSGCGENSGNTVRMNDCGIFMRDSTPAEDRRIVQQAMPDLDRATWSNFTDRVLTSGKLEDNLHSSWPHRVVDLNASLPDAWKSPDGVILFSRVGYSTDQRKAVVYVLFLSYMDKVPTSGNFFMFSRNADGAWRPIGRAAYMESGG